MPHESWNPQQQLLLLTTTPHTLVPLVVRPPFTKRKFSVRARQRPLIPAACALVVAHAPTTWTTVRLVAY